jgi:hypothetical protein
MNEQIPNLCPACGGSGKTRRFRLIPLVVTVAALLLIVLGEVLKRSLGIDAASGGIRAMPLKVLVDLSCLVFAGGMIAFFLRVQCPQCQGSGTSGDGPAQN